jgi:glycine hydroxymethyltransferase
MNVNRGFKIVSGGTDNHLFLLDLSDRRITGKEVETALGLANITVNKNAIPNDPRPPMITSGIRIGTAAATTRGFGKDDIQCVAHWIADMINANGAEPVVQRVRRLVLTLCQRYPVYSAPWHNPPGTV